MDNFVLTLMNDYGYIGMFLGMMLESIIVVIPSELILATGGILASKGIFTFWGAFLTGLIGSVFCASIIYCMGYCGGKAFSKKYGKYFFMKEEDIDKSNYWFNKYGLIAACVGRNLPVVRTLISLPIGIARLSFLKFLLYTTIGSIPWTFVFVYFGNVLGNNWVIMETYTSRLKIPIIILIILLTISYLIKLINKYCRKEKKV